MPKMNRREFLEGCAAATLTPLSGARDWSARTVAPVLRWTGRRGISLDRDWLFGGKSKSDAIEGEFDDAEF